MPENVDKSLDDGKIKVELAAPGFPNHLVATFVCGVWVTAAASRVVDLTSWVGITADRFTSYAVAVGAGGIIFPLIFLLMIKLCRKPFEKELVSVKEEPVTLQKICAIFLVLWWGCGAGIGTFEVCPPLAFAAAHAPSSCRAKVALPMLPPEPRFHLVPQRPFSVPGNGYFALWAGFLFSLMALGDVMESVKSHMSTQKESADGPSVSGPARGLFFAAVVLVVALIPWVDKGSDAVAFAESLFGMIAAATTIVACLILMLITKLDKKAVQVIALLLCLTWAAVAGIMTFRAPFLTVGNGYFSSYAGLFMAFQLSSVAYLHK